MIEIIRQAPAKVRRGIICLWLAITVILIYTITRIIDNPPEDTKLIISLVVSLIPLVIITTFTILISIRRDWGRRGLLSAFIIGYLLSVFATNQVPLGGYSPSMEQKVYNFITTILFCFGTHWLFSTEAGEWFKKKTD
jgi:hypothetical protein